MECDPHLVLNTVHPLNLKVAPLGATSLFVVIVQWWCQLLRPTVTLDIPPWLWTKFFLSQHWFIVVIKNDDECVPLDYRRGCLLTLWWSMKVSTSSCEISGCNNTRATYKYLLIVSTHSVKSNCTIVGSIGSSVYKVFLTWLCCVAYLESKREYWLLSRATSNLTLISKELHDLFQAITAFVGCTNYGDYL